MEPRVPAFRFQRKTVFLTYAQCPLEKERILEHLQSLGDLEEYIIARELHANGDPHIHVYAKWADKISTRDPRFFDIRSHDNSIDYFHPNIASTIKSVAAVKKYCTKDGDYIENCIKKTAYQQAVEADTPDQAMDIIKGAHPKDYLIYHDRILSTLRKIHAPRPVKTHTMSDFNIHPLDFDASKVWLLWGPTAMGKTSYAAAHFNNPLWVNDIDDLKHFDVHAHDGIIFDDMDFYHWPATAIIHLLDSQQPRTIRCRHSNAYVPAGVKKIFTYNGENPFFGPTSKFPPNLDQEAAIERRFMSLRISRKCF